MAELRVPSRKTTGSGNLLNITPDSAGWKYVGFSVQRHKSGDTYVHDASDREHCLVFLTGSGKLILDDKDRGVLGNRDSVFEDVTPDCAYVAAGDSFTITATTDLEFALCSGPGRADLKSRVISHDAISIDHRGETTNSRIVRNILPETEEAESLLIAEVITPSGHWSSYPPHKHDTDAVPSESALEETYYHRLNPPQGFAFQRVYTDDRSLDETMCVEDGDTVLVPKGYHPVGVPHGYDLYYLNVMAGPKRTWLITNDPAHEWIVEP